MLNLIIKDLRANRLFLSIQWAGLSFLASIVTARYLSALFMIAAGIVLFYLLAFLYRLVFSTMSSHAQPTITTGEFFTFVFVLALLISVSFPLIFRFGLTVGISISSLLFLIIFLGIPIAFPNSNIIVYEGMEKITESAGARELYPLLGAIMLASLGASAALSVKLYKGKDL